MLVRVVEGLLAVGLGVSLWLVNPWLVVSLICVAGLMLVDAAER